MLSSMLCDLDDVSLVAGVGRREADSLKMVGLTSTSLGNLVDHQVASMAK
jgi:predicted RecB family nuclease